MRFVAIAVALLFWLSNSFRLERVSVVLESFDCCKWQRSWSRAAGKIMTADEGSPESPNGKSLYAEIHFSGRGFEWFSVKPAKPIWIPGEAKSVTIRYKVSELGYTIALEFLDGWGRSEVGGKRLSLVLPVKTSGQWQIETFPIPEDWLRPIAISGLNIHNWERQDQRVTLKVWIDQIEVQTDLSSADTETGLPNSWRPNPNEKSEQGRTPPPVSLMRVELATPAECHVFAGEQPTVVFRAWNWTSQPKSGKLSVRVVNFWGDEVFSTQQPIEVSGFIEKPFAIPLKRFGWYQATVTLELQDGKVLSEQLAFAFVPKPRDLTETEKLLSPYGLNVHGGRERFVVEPFRKAGVVWFRDYAFGFKTMKQAKGNGSFDGWPWYHQLLWHYQRLGAKLLACLQGAIERPKPQDGKVSSPPGPTPDWRREIASIIVAFPQITHWELDNEYDLPEEVKRVEEPINWGNYRAYHKAFAEIVDAIGGGTLVAVEQGQAGIYPQRIRTCVGSGDFEKIAVINVHHYCRTDEPENNIVNVAEGRGEKLALFFDLLREAKEAATSDNKQRQLWLTEFGWDTLAGYVVSPFEQAVYLQRGWLLALAAGVDKAFWFYDFDSPEPKQFFDGCGLLTADGQPKLALCALAALTYLLPVPRYVGDCNAGAGTQGFVFETDGKLVAVLWSTESRFGPLVSFDSGRLYDFLANPIEGKVCQLSPAPIFAVGISRDSRWFKQTAYSLDTPYLVTVAAGDNFAIKLKVQNNRSEDIETTLRIEVPQNWRVDRTEASVKVPQGAQAFVPFSVTVSPDEPEGFREVLLVAEEGGQRLKEIRVKVFVTKAVTVKVMPIEGLPGETRLFVQLTNNSQRTLSGVLRFKLPKNWQVSLETVPIDKLEPGETKSVEVGLTWSTEWQQDETAQVLFGPLGQILASDFIVPNQFRVHRAPKVQIDGDLSEWGERWAVPFWLLRSTFGEPNAKVYLAWALEGLYVAVEVRNSIVKVADPKNFWTGDCLELFIDTRNDKRPRLFEPGDHQFWFVPLIGEGRVYAGQWKRGNEIPETKYDLSDVKGVARKTQDGYIMEFLLPAKYLHGYNPQVGVKLGLNINLTVWGKHRDREVFWHRQKDWNTLHSPHLWGTVELSE